MAYEENFTADRLQDALVAETIFNWVWLERLPREDDPDKKFLKGLFPPENDSHGWERVNYYPEWYQPAKPETPCFTDWPRCGYKPNRKTPWQTEDSECPRFTTDVRHDYMVLERVITHVITYFNSFDQVEEFKKSLDLIWDARYWRLQPCYIKSFMLYEPGDYAKAALMMFKKFNPEHPAFVENRVYRRKDT
jgi:hypothetical protein